MRKTWVAFQLSKHQPTKGKNRLYVTNQGWWYVFFGSWHPHQSHIDDYMGRTQTMPTAGSHLYMGSSREPGWQGGDLLLIHGSPLSGRIWHFYVCFFQPIKCKTWMSLNPSELIHVLLVKHDISWFKVIQGQEHIVLNNPQLYHSKSLKEVHPFNQKSTTPKVTPISLVIIAISVKNK